MGLRISQVFQLIFDFNEEDRKAYETRRWFRRPSPSMEAPDPTDDVAAAEKRLTDVIRTRISGWANTSGIDAVTEQFQPAHHIPPRLPYDVFAIAAHLVEQAGIYHHLQPSKHRLSGAESGRRFVEIDESDRELVRRAALAWSSLPPADGSMEKFVEVLLDARFWNDLEPLFESWWVVFGAHADCEVRERPVDQSGEVTPVWWKHAWRLLAIADEAAAGTGFVFDVDELRDYLANRETEIKWFEADVIFEHFLAASAEVEDADEQPAEFADVNSLSVARGSMLNVLPKVRTPSVGCTLRSISHHLALLPPLGIVKGQWTPNYRRREVASEVPDKRMNLLLVPMPFSLGARCFRPTSVEQFEGSYAGPAIGYFDVEQDWLQGDEKRVVDFVRALIEEAKTSTDKVHGVVFPELALDYPRFEALRTMLRDACEGIEIIVAGVKTDKDGNLGNLVAAGTFRDSSAGTSGGRVTVREKHHRWKLDPGQIKDYGLQGTLSPERSWWEDIALKSRQVDFTVMRKDSLFAAMICEDLARVDPCQQIIRAVGPNLVIALLMDAPQIEARWPARYATVLAEDPGCAVLTLTSRGLMTLQDRLGVHRSSGSDRIIALWRDDKSARPITIECPYDAQATLLTIIEKPSLDVALDGRRDGHAKAWHYSGHVPVRIANVREQYGDILGPENLASF